MRIVPKINGSAECTSSRLILNEGALTVNAGPFDKKCLEAFCARFGFEAAYVSADSAALVLHQDDQLEPEEYNLTVAPQTISIKAANETAVIWALSSLSQLISEDGSVECCQIIDKPMYTHRGLSLDCARHFFPIQIIRQIIEQMSRVKMNRLHWHLTDDQGWRVESLLYPRLHQQHGDEYYSQTEIKDLVAFAQARGVEIIPEIDMPGHITALLAAYPEYSCSGQPVKLASRGGIYPIVLCAGNEKTYTLAENLLTEVCSLFPSPEIHIGGDEAPKREWKTCPHCQAKIRAEGLKNETELQGYFSNRLIDLLAWQGKSAICWNDALEAENINKAATVQFWSVQYTNSFEQFIKTGGKFVFSDMFAFYLDYPHSMTSLRRLYEAPLVIGSTDYAGSPALVGLEVCAWSEQFSESRNLEEKLFPRLYAAAEKMWSNKLDYADFEPRLRHFLSTHHPESIACIPEDHWNPQGAERRAETQAFLKVMNAGISADVADFFVPNEQFRRKFAMSFFDPADMDLLMN